MPPILIFEILECFSSAKTIPNLEFERNETFFKENKTKWMESVLKKTL